MILFYGNANRIFNQIKARDRNFIEGDKFDDLENDSLFTTKTNESNSYFHN